MCSSDLATADGAVRLAPSSSFSVLDIAGNAQTSAGGTDRSVTYDTTSAIVTLTQAAGQADPAKSDSIAFTFSSNEDLQTSSVTASDFEATNATGVTVTGSGDTYTVTVTATTDGAVRLAPSSSFSVLDIAGNATTTAGGSDRTVTYDSTPATVTLEQAATQADPAKSATIRFTLSSNEIGRAHV